MNRTAALAAVVVMLASSPTFGQSGGVGGMGGGMGGMGGGMGGQGMAPGMMGQGGRFAGAGSIEVRRSAQVEMEGGQHLSGKIELRTVVVDGDLGRYLISPFKIKAIRFLKPADGVKPANEPAANNNGNINAGDDVLTAVTMRQNRAAVLRASRAGGFGGFEPTGPIRGKVITTTGKEIVGTIHLPADFRLELDFGTLTLAAEKLRSITFEDSRQEDKPANAGAGAPAAADDRGHAEPGVEASSPRYFRQGEFLIVISQVGDRVMLYNLETKDSRSLELSGSKDAPLSVVPIIGQNLAALLLNGPKVTRIAVGDLVTGTWHSQELREPIDGRAVPIVSAGIVVYNLGQRVYAYSAESQRWDVAVLPAGVRATPTVGSGTATIETNGHLYNFAGKTGEWSHVDVRALVDGNAGRK